MHRLRDFDSALPLLPLTIVSVQYDRQHEYQFSRQTKQKWQFAAASIRPRAEEQRHHNRHNVRGDIVPLMEIRNRYLHLLADVRVRRQVITNFRRVIVIGATRFVYVKRLLDHRRQLECKHVQEHGWLDADFAIPFHRFTIAFLLQFCCAHFCLRFFSAHRPLENAREICAVRSGT